jgi:hypothetical protein
MTLVMYVRKTIKQQQSPTEGASSVIGNWIRDANDKAKPIESGNVVAHGCGRRMLQFHFDNKTITPLVAVSVYDEAKEATTTYLPNEKVVLKGEANANSTDKLVTYLGLADLNSGASLLVYETNTGDIEATEPSRFSPCDQSLAVTSNVKTNKDIAKAVRKFLVSHLEVTPMKNLSLEFDKAKRIAKSEHSTESSDFDEILESNSDNGSSTKDPSKLPQSKPSRDGRKDNFQAKQIEKPDPSKLPQPKDDGTPTTSSNSNTRENSDFDENMESNSDNGSSTKDPSKLPQPKDNGTPTTSSTDDGSSTEDSKGTASGGTGRSQLKKRKSNSTERESPQNGSDSGTVNNKRKISEHSAENSDFDEITELIYDHGSSTEDSIGTGSGGTGRSQPKKPRLTKLSTERESPQNGSNSGNKRSSLRLSAKAHRKEAQDAVLKTAESQAAAAAAAEKAAAEKAAELKTAESQAAAEKARNLKAASDARRKKEKRRREKPVAKKLQLAATREQDAELKNELATKERELDETNRKLSELRKKLDDAADKTAGTKSQQETLAMRSLVDDLESEKYKRRLERELWEFKEQTLKKKADMELTDRGVKDTFMNEIQQKMNDLKNGVLSQKNEEWKDQVITAVNNNKADPNQMAALFKNCIAFSESLLTGVAKLQHPPSTMSKEFPVEGEDVSIKDLESKKMQEWSPADVQKWLAHSYQPGLKPNALKNTVDGNSLILMNKNFNLVEDVWPLLSKFERARFENALKACVLAYA